MNLTTASSMHNEFIERLNTLSNPLKTQIQSRDGRYVVTF